MSKHVRVKLIVVALLTAVIAGAMIASGSGSGAGTSSKGAGSAGSLR
ncbi:hypothetical protein [Actinomadura rupiterrae]|nr:hypothetical protein [Actinomadura rupiterrae]MCP2340277.1 hypothetical protein [Actinomadura rupiterrae]